MAVTISLHSCTSSKNINVFPGTNGFLVKADSRNSKSFAPFCSLNSSMASGCSTKLISTTLSKHSLPTFLTEKVLPTCLAPVINRERLSLSIKLRISSSALRFTISTCICRCKDTTFYLSTSINSKQKNTLFQREYFCFLTLF